jgi:hypothetical protein
MTKDELDAIISDIDASFEDTVKAIKVLMAENEKLMESPTLH